MIPLNLRKMSREMRKIRLDQPHQTYEQALAQTRRVHEESQRGITERARRYHLDCIAIEGCKASTQTQS